MPAGAAWSAAIRVNDDATTRSQFLPRIALDQATGHVAVIWYDCRNIPGNNVAELAARSVDNCTFAGLTVGSDGQLETPVFTDERSPRIAAWR